MIAGGLKTKGITMIKKLLDLQLFSDEADNETKEGGDVATEANEKKSGKSDASEKKFTNEDVDRIVQKRLASERRKYEKLLNQEEQETDFDEREKNILRREMRLNAYEKLQADGLPKELAEHLDYTDNETQEKSYDSLKDVFLKASYKGKTPKVLNNKAQANSIDKAFEPPNRYS